MLFLLIKIGSATPATGTDRQATAMSLSSTEYSRVWRDARSVNDLSGLGRVWSHAAHLSFTDQALEDLLSAPGLDGRQQHPPRIPLMSIT